MLKKYNSREELTDDEIDVVVRDYSSRVFSNKRDRHVQMQKILPGNLGKNSKILDYGCGVGVVSQFFREKYNCIVDGVEISEIELHKAKATFEEDNKLRFILSSEFKYPKNYYDLIFSSQVIEHVHNPGNYLSKWSYIFYTSRRRKLFSIRDGGSRIQRKN